MKNYWIFALVVFAISACKQEDTATRIAKDVCACVIPVVEEQKTIDDVLRRGNQAEIDALELTMQQSQQRTSECFQNLEKKHGSLEEYQSRIMEEMKKHCPEAAALLSSGGQQ